MAQKTLQAKVTRGDTALLRGVHEAFHKELLFLLGWLFKMKRGELGEDYQVVFDSIRNAQQASQRIEPLTSPAPWNPDKQMARVEERRRALEAWLRDNPAYASVKPEFDAFTKKYGDTDDRRWKNELSCSRGAISG